MASVMKAILEYTPPTKKILDYQEEIEEILRILIKNKQFDLTPLANSPNGSPWRTVFQTRKVPKNEVKIVAGIASK